ncbi:hypothetical protein HCN52_00630 [Streptomyces bohaiensis]|uniref:HEAT repeat domain-containing protein n=1 Tax=Streptomyces bohaiensis TaxID=1431344 RepID=A0ABX1C3S6_9ACTN|nr:hypothetical protein [Streptomyces bohaiensis]
MDQAASPDWSTRVRAAEALASHAADPHAAAALHTLLLDSMDTAVPRRAAAALWQEHSTAALRLVAAALADADETTADWILTGVHDALADNDGDHGELTRRCAGLLRDSDARVRGGAAELLKWLR